MTSNAGKHRDVAPASATPFTPMRRFLGKLRPMLSLRKRGRGKQTSPNAMVDCQDVIQSASQKSAQPESSNNFRPVTALDINIDTKDSSSLGPSCFSSPPKPVGAACVAIQQDDRPFDAIVITTLPCYPFCCHEDLLLMGRQQLIDVAITFNTHLPHVTKIEISDAVTDAHIRNCIERIAGIVPDIPAAPQRARAWVDKRRREESPSLLVSELGLHIDKFPSPPVSPLSMRSSRRRSFSLISTLPRRLERLDEEDEETEERPLKKRKVSDNKATPTRFLYRQNNIMISPSRQSDHSQSTSSEMLVSPASIATPTFARCKPETPVHSSSNHRTNVDDFANMDIC